MIPKIIILLFLIAILSALGNALYHLFFNKKKEGMVKALTLRILFSFSLFLLLMLGMITGVLHPHNFSLFVPKTATSSSSS